MASLLALPERKRIRAALIADYVRAAGYPGVVCFSCGNASAALKGTGLFVVDVSPGGDLRAERWWSPEDIHRVWPSLLDATSGHLTAPLMARLSDALKAHIGPLSARSIVDVPTGSGETIACLRWAYPAVTFRAVFDGTTPGTIYEPEAPLVAVAIAKESVDVAA